MAQKPFKIVQQDSVHRENKEIFLFVHVKLVLSIVKPHMGYVINKLNTFLS